jgi:hypothetical protein
MKKAFFIKTSNGECFVQQQPLSLWGEMFINAKTFTQRRKVAKDRKENPAGVAFA